MIYLEAFQVAILAALFVNASLSDLKSGIVSNKSILISLAIGLASAIPYYVFFAADCLLAYAVNVVIGIGISLILYAMGIWGAGDSKLLSVTILVFPARLYCMGNRSLASCFLLIALVFIVAFIYVIGDTVCIGLKRKDLFKIQVKQLEWKSYIKGFLFFFLLLNILNSVTFKLLPEFLLTDALLLTAIQFVIILIGLRLEEKSNWVTVIVMGAVWAVLLLLKYSRFDLSSINWGTYLAVIALVVFRAAADKYNYKTIPVEELKPGMILSMGSILAFSGSRVKGLPSFSSEDLKSRLSGDEVDSVVRWSGTKNGQDTITIVRKIPFALFIAIGTLLFALLEVLAR